MDGWMDGYKYISAMIRYHSITFHFTSYLFAYFLKYVEAIEVTAVHILTRLSVCKFVKVMFMFTRQNKRTDEEVMQVTEKWVFSVFVFPPVSYQ